MFLDHYIEEIQGLSKENEVISLYVFGSVLNDLFGEDSDVDFLVDIKGNDPIDYAEKYFDLKFKLQDLIKKPIDLLQQKGIKDSHLLQSIDKSKIKFYEAWSAYLAGRYWQIN